MRPHLLRRLCIELKVAGFSPSITMNNNPRTWLQVYVDAVMEKDPYKRLALVRELKNMPREDASGDLLEQAASRPGKKAEVVRRRH